MHPAFSVILFTSLSGAGYFMLALLGLFGASGMVTPDPLAGWVAFVWALGAVTAGWGHNRRSLMPTWLEWLRARHGLSLLWGSTVYIVGLLMGALRWFKVSL